MQIQQIVNGIFRQDFSDLIVLGRTLFGGAILLTGFTSILQAESYASYAPEYVPFGTLFAVLLGVLFILCGFFILANLHVRKSSRLLIVLLLLLVVVVYLPLGDILSLFQSLGYIGAAFLVSGIAKASKESEPKEAEKTS